jgi:predicted porin
MMKKRKVRWMGVLIAGLFLVGSIGPLAWAADDEQMRQMKLLIQQQQEQLEAQQRALDELKQKMEEMSVEQTEMKRIIPTTAEGQAEPLATKTDMEKMTTSGNDKVALEISGQVNRAALASMDGENNYYYFVDNDNSSSRIRLKGTAQLNDDWSVGSRFEAEFQSNDSNVVNQLDKNPGDAGFKLRWFDAQAQSKTFGKFYLGKGSTASDSTSEVDLSGTSVVGYSSIADMAGGLIFFDDGGQGYDTGIRVKDVFNNMDGLSRENRFRYDSPKFFGFWAQGGLISGDGGDVSLWYADKLGPVKLAGAISYARPGSNTGDAREEIINGSISALWNGLNLTVALGQTKWNEDEVKGDAFNYDDQELFYAKLGYRREFFNLGESRFSIDYALNKNVLDNATYRNSDSEANSLGLMFVQKIDAWSSEAYLGARLHQLDDLREIADPNTQTDFNDLWAIMGGMRIKF